MYRNNTVSAVVPVYNGENLIDQTIQGIPDYIDFIIIVDDCSSDKTAEKVKESISGNHRIIYIRHETTLGIGAAIRTGYIWCRDHNADIAVVMNGDFSMNPEDIPNLLDPIVDNHADYTKGNRLITGEAWQKLPHIRYFGDSVLTLMTKIVSGYWHVTDSQSGYTAMSKKVLHLIPIENIHHGYGYQNDILVRLNIYNFRVMDISINPEYRALENRGTRFHAILFPVSLLLLRLFFRRMFQKYVVRDFHPLIFFYAMGILILLVDIPIIIRLFLQWRITGFIPTINTLAILFCTFTSLQFILFAMLFDMEANKELKGNDNHTHSC
ncbi:glycosyltransferase family 2 protein [bacterium]|nr:glycosyltransferase family 2 protein [bacterium]